MTATTQHTPTPYHFASLPRRSNFEERGTRFEVVADGKRVAILNGCQPGDAAFIVTACNAHEKLVAALRGLLNVMDCDSEDGWAAEQRANGRAALAKVTPA